MKVIKTAGEFKLEQADDSPTLHGIQILLMTDDDKVVEGMLISQEAMDLLTDQQQGELAAIMEMDETDPMKYYKEVKRIVLGNGQPTEREPEPGEGGGPG